VDEKKQIDLQPGEWRKDGEKYPRKTIFGLTDYGPPKITWDLVLGLVIMNTAIYLGLHWWRQ
jgi:hypothetical protein